MHNNCDKCVIIIITFLFLFAPSSTWLEIAVLSLWCLVCLLHVAAYCESCWVAHNEDTLAFFWHVTPWSMPSVRFLLKFYLWSKKLADIGCSISGRPWKLPFQALFPLPLAKNTSSNKKSCEIEHRHTVVSRVVTCTGCIWRPGNAESSFVLLKIKLSNRLIGKLIVNRGRTHIALYEPSTQSPHLSLT